MSQIAIDSAGTVESMGGGGGEKMFSFFSPICFEAEAGHVEVVKGLLEAKANVDHFTIQGGRHYLPGWTALSVAVKKKENLMPEKRPRSLCKRIALLAVALRTRYRSMVLFPSLLRPPLP